MAVWLTHRMSQLCIYLKSSIPVYQSKMHLRGLRSRRPLEKTDEVLINDEVLATSTKNEPKFSHPKYDHYEEKQDTNIKFKTENKSNDISSNVSKSEKPLKPKKKLNFLTTPVTAEEQHGRIAAVTSPLYLTPYNKQLSLKKSIAHKAINTFQQLLKYRKVDREIYGGRELCHVGDIRSYPNIMNYRNKDEYSIHRGVDGNPKTVGFFIGHLSDPLMVCVPPTNIIILSEKHKAVAQSFQNFIRQSPRDACLNFQDGGTWRNIIVRSTIDGELMVIVIIHPQNIGEGGITEIMSELEHFYFVGPGADLKIDSLYLQACGQTRCSRELAPYRLIAGKKHIVEKCMGLQFQISPDSFFQINVKAAEVLYQTILEIAEVSPLTTLLDVCCGTGTISLVMAPHVRNTIGFDHITGSIDDAISNAKRNNITNTWFIKGKAEEVLPSLVTHLNDYTDVVAVVNPGRGGLSPRVIDTLLQCKPISKLIYISCRPDGQAMRNFVDLVDTKTKKYLGECAPFRPVFAIPVDMFPHTNHIELVIRFDRME